MLTRKSPSWWNFLNIIFQKLNECKIIFLLFCVYLCFGAIPKVLHTNLAIFDSPAPHVALFRFWTPPPPPPSSTYASFLFWPPTLPPLKKVDKKAITTKQKANTCL